MNFGQNPFVPRKKADILIVDGSSKQSIVSLKERGIRVVPTIKCNDVYDAIAYHPDIVVHPINYKTLIVAPNVFDYYNEALKDTGITLLKGEKNVEEKYPENIAYNVARISNYAIHNFKYTDEKLKYYLTKEGLDLINVNQGYSKCSVCIVGEKAMITSDISIHKALAKSDIDILLIDQGYIELPGLDYGFIGGSTGLLSEKEILFTGKYNHHPNKQEVNKFLKKNGVQPIFLNEEKIIDIGSIIPLNCN